MAPNPEEDTSIDVGRGLTDLRRMVDGQHAQLTEIRQDTHTQFAEIRELLQGLTLQIRQRPERVEKDRALGFAHCQPPNQNRNLVKEFACNQPIHQNISGGYSYYHYDNRNEFEGELFKNHDDYQSIKRQANFRYYDKLPKFSGLEFFEDRFDWILDIDEFFEYTKTPSEQRWRFLLLKLTGLALQWWLKLQSSRDRLGKRRIHAWSRIKRLLVERFLPWNYGELLKEKYGPKQQNTTIIVKDVVEEVVKEVVIQVDDTEEIDVGNKMNNIEVVEEIIFKVADQNNIALEVCAFELEESPTMELTATLQEFVAGNQFSNKGVSFSAILEVLNCGSQIDGDIITTSLFPNLILGRVMNSPMT